MRKYVVVLNTGEAPVSKSLFAAFGHREDPVKQVFGKTDAYEVAHSLDGIGSKNVREEKRPMSAWVLPLSHECVSVNERTGYVRINAALFNGGV